MDEQVVASLAKIRRTLSEDGDYVPIDSEAEGEAGDLGAVNADVASERVDAYLTTIVDSLMDEYEIDEDDAFDFVTSVAEAMAEAGDLPELPGEDDEDDMQSAWLGAATTAGFQATVLEVAAESAEE